MATQIESKGTDGAGSGTVEDGRRVCIVTGGAQGIGRAVSSLFFARGYHVAIGDIDEEAGQELVKLLQLQQTSCSSSSSSTGSCLFFHCDVSIEESVKAMVDRVAAQYHHIDVIVNNAGIANPLYAQPASSELNPIETLSLATWNAYISTNLTSVFLTTKHALQYMRRSSQGGAIINISSTRALMSEPHTEPYAASKAGMVGLTHSLAVSLQRERVRVNCISPGWIEVSELRKASWRATHPTASLRALDHEQHPAGRVGRGEDIAQMAYFLAQPELSGFVTGQNFVVDGGMTKKMIYQD